MTDKDDQLLTVMARRNWYLLAILVLLSLIWRSEAVTLGVLAGGLLAIIAYGWLYRSLVKTLANPGSYSVRGFRFSYFIRLTALAIAVFLLIAKLRVNPVALSAGLSVVVINIFWTVLRRLY